MRMQSLATFPNFLVFQQESFRFWDESLANAATTAEAHTDTHDIRANVLVFNWNNASFIASENLFTTFFVQSRNAQRENMSPKRETHEQMQFRPKKVLEEKKRLGNWTVRESFISISIGGRTDENQVLNRHVDPTLQMHLRSIRSFSFFLPLLRRLTAACSFWAKRASQRGRSRASSKSEVSSTLLRLLVHIYYCLAVLHDSAHSDVCTPAQLWTFKALIKMKNPSVATHVGKCPKHPISYFAIHSPPFTLWWPRTATSRAPTEE